MANGFVDRPEIIDKLNNSRGSILADLSPKTYGSGRVCKFPWCETKINMYRDSEVCSVHTIAYCEMLEKKLFKDGSQAVARRGLNLDCVSRQIWDKRECQHV